MNIKNRFWTARYAAINIFFFAGYSAIHAYASVFLLSKGFSNSTIGIILALANITSVLVQPVVAAFIDKGGRVTNRNTIITTILLMAAMALLMAFVNVMAVVFLAFAMCYMLQMMIQPIIVALDFEYEKRGCRINFGLARGLGSCGFAAISPIIGVWVTNIGPHIIPYVFIGTLLVCLFFTATFVTDNSDTTVTKDSDEAEAAANNNLIDFVKTYPKFIVYVIAIACFFFGHNTINDYLIQIIRPLGANETTMGYMVSMAAFLELPTMAVFVYLAKKIDCGILLKFAGVMFFVKIGIMLLATNIPMAFISMACQMFAYALYIPANAYYATKVMMKNDQVKGQAVSSAAITLGGTFSGLICGRILDSSGAHTMLLVATIVSAVGVALILFSVEKVGRKV